MKRYKALLVLVSTATTLFLVPFFATAVEPLVSVDGQFIGIRDRRQVTVTVSVMRANAPVQSATALLDDQLRFAAVLLNVNGFNLQTDTIRIEVRHTDGVTLPIGFDAANPTDIAYANFVEAPLSDIAMSLGSIRVKWLVRVRVIAPQGLNFMSFYGDPSASVGGLLTNVFNPWPTFVLANDDTNQALLNAFITVPANEPLQPWQGFLVSLAETRTIEFWGAEWTPEQMVVPLLANVINVRGVPFANANITPDALWAKLVEIQAQPRALLFYDAGLAMWYLRTANFTTPLTSSQRRAFNLTSGEAWIVVPSADKNLDMRTLASAAPSRDVQVLTVTELPNEDILALAPLTPEQRKSISDLTGITPSNRVLLSATGKLPVLWGDLKR